MHQALLDDLHKKQMGAFHSEMRKMLFPTIRKEISDAEKKAAAKEAAKVAKAAAKALGRGRGGGGRRGRGGGRRGRGGGRRGRGGGRGSWKSQDSDEEDEELSPESESSEEDADFIGPNPVAGATNNESSDEESDSTGPSASGDPGAITTNALPSIQEDSDDDEKSDLEETGIVSFNGHRWESRRNLEFQVVWADGDIIWRTAILTTLYYYPNVNSLRIPSCGGLLYP
ncbi:hypothetical protein B0H14DRAFT_3071581 [Mycena olivaceomarginata]|nr:hypothetical protein B0H14DRAFT_3071581 [Mycena olivaceomarginata]